jgi:hypothetical protein
MPKPNLFIVGAMKSGTSSLHNYLKSHPDIFMSKPKEPSYFVPREQLRAIFPEMERRGYWQGEDKYLAVFKDAGFAKVIGESSTNYSKRPLIDGIPEKLKAFSPDAKIIYIMRDPVERTISHYWHMAKFNSESRGMLEAIREDPHYRETSYYAMQLRPYLEVFGAGNVATLTFEDLKTNPRKELARLFDWLGLEDRSKEIDEERLGKTYNVTPQIVVQATSGGYLRRLRYSRFWNVVGPHVPQQLRKLALNLSEKKVQKVDIDTREVVEYLRTIQIRQTEELSALLGKGFEIWKTLYG